jgi:hypothetical protein
MKTRHAPTATLGAAFAAALALALAGCASQPITPPTVADAQFSSNEVSPGDSVQVSFTLDLDDPASVERVYLRGLPKNTVLAGTRTELDLPTAPSSAYASDITIERPAADGQYPLELVIETSERAFVAPLGTLAISDTPSRIVHAQFVGGSHAADDCLASTKLLSLEYTVADDNGASDFVAPAVAAVNPEAEGLVFFPRWEPVAWLDGKPGINLNRPTQDTVEQELVSSDIRINCAVATDQLYEFVIQGQDVSRSTGKSELIASQIVTYYVE